MHIFYGFKLWYWRRLLRVPYAARRSSQSILNEINPEFHWKDWGWNWSFNSLATWWEGSQLTGKHPDAQKDWGQEENWATEDEMVGWHHWLSGLGLSKLRELVKDGERHQLGREEPAEQTPASSLQTTRSHRHMSAVWPGMRENWTAIPVGRSGTWPGTRFIQ